jgi:ABC-type transport system involved in cytochrome c biogenesis permease subunit
MAAVFAMGYVIVSRSRMSLAAFALHSSFVVILIGAAVTHFCGEQGTVKLSDACASVRTFKLTDGETAHFPFAVKSERSQISYYSATSTPMDFATDLTITDAGRTVSAHVSMNNIFSYRGYRFYQTAIGSGYTVLSVSHDPWGIGITYAGYALLFMSSIAFFFTRKSRFRAVLKAVTCAVCILAAGVSANAQQVLQRPLAENFGKMLVYWNGRVAPAQTMAREFCTKIYGSPSYNGFTAEQVLTGWIFYYDDWKNEPFIKVKDASIRDALGISGKYASLRDFYGAGEYKLKHMLTAADGTSTVALQADEKVSLVSQVCTGKALKIYPLLASDGGIVWQSWTDNCGSDVDINDALFVSTSMERMAQNIAHGRYNAANDCVTEICEFQRRDAVNSAMPSEFKVNVERVYNLAHRTLIAAIVAIIAGLLAFFNVLHPRFARIVGAILLLYLTVVMAMRWIVSGHIPVTNGFETMQAAAWLALVITLAVRRIAVILPMGLIVSGLALMVSMMGESNPAVTPLMPVLSSPLLSVHVMLVMISYALFAMMMLNSLASFIQPTRAAYLANVSTLLLYPAVMTMAAGIFVGAIWANQSWGRYWGWDPKETWALVTLLVYALPLHAASFKAFSRPNVIHLYNLFAFLSVLITYFGVNFVLSGMHSYAAQ